MVMIHAASVALLALTAVAAQHSSHAGHGQSHGHSHGHGHGKTPSGDDWTKNIKNVVILVQENRSFDTLAGGFTYDSSIDGLVGKQFCNPMNITQPTQNIVCADKIAPAHDVAIDDPNHSVTGTSFGLYSTYHPDEAGIKAGNVHATLKGFVQEQQVAHKFTGNESRASEIINYYTSAHIPVFEDMAKNYVLFDQWFCDVPGPTNPNRAYVTSGTSHGHGSNDAGFSYGGLPQTSIFQQLSEKNVTWINYSNSTDNGKGYGTPEEFNAKTVSGFNPDSLFYNWTWTSGAVNNSVKGIAQFYEDAKNGDLPQLSYINPECCSFDSMHPPSPISLGENFIKGIYEALTSSPQWNQTLFILTFDEGGGFGDHVVPPVNVPAGDGITYAEKAADGKNATFDFTRLGVRVPTMLISPWVGKGVVEHSGSNKGRTYTHASIQATLSQLWNLENLTPRTAWSSTFEHLFLDKMRTDTPATLPPVNSW